VADFSIQDAAFTGFGVVREHRGYLAVWAVLALAVFFILTAVVIVLAGPTLMSLQALSASERRDPTIVFPLLSRVGPLYLVLTPVIIVLYGILYAGMNRAVLRPGDPKFAYLAFGPDEFRQMGVLVLGFCLFVAIYIALVIGLLIVAVLLNTVAHAPPAVLGLFAVSLAFAVMTWLAVRLSLASALTFETRRVTLFGSWALTRGRFWPIFGTYVLVLALAAVILILTNLVILGIVAAATGGNLLAALAPPDMQSLGAYFTVARSLQFILGAGVSALMWPVVLTPPAAILRQISLGEKGLFRRGFP
jgi:hypothetical protein